MAGQSLKNFTPRHNETAQGYASEYNRPFPFSVKAGFRDFIVRASDVTHPLRRRIAVRLRESERTHPMTRLPSLQSQANFRSEFQERGIAVTLRYASRFSLLNDERCACGHSVLSAHATRAGLDPSERSAKGVRTTLRW